VAAAAALAAQHGDQLDHRRRRQRHGEDRERFAFEERSTENDADEEIPTAMTASFHSEGGRESGPKRVSWSTERHSRRGASVDHLAGVSPSSGVPAPHQLTSTDSVIDPSGRGRTLEREADSGPHIHSASRDHRGSRSRRTTMVFLSAWALFGIGTVAGVGRGTTADTNSSIGRVLAAKGIHMPTPISIVDSYMLYDASLFTQQWSERVVGRIFAWLCTTLYLTSRLPQIWKNVRPLLHFPWNRRLNPFLAVC
jgi:hypothetical protein